MLLGKFKMLSNWKRWGVKVRSINPGVKCNSWALGDAGTCSSFPRRQKTSSKKTPSITQSLYPQTSHGNEDDLIALFSL